MPKKFGLLQLSMSIRQMPLKATRSGWAEYGARLRLPEGRGTFVAKAEQDCSRGSTVGKTEDFWNPDSAVDRQDWDSRKGVGWYPVPTAGT